MTSAVHHEPVKASSDQHQLSTPMQQCVEDCVQCHSICMSTVQYCLRMGGAHADPHHIGLLLDCAEMCETAAHFILRGSDQHVSACRVCAEICEKCATASEQLGPEDQLRGAVEACRTCAASCNGVIQEV